MLDVDGYPDETSLERIEQYDLATESLDGLLALIRENWNWPDWGFVRKGDDLWLHTGGWSGNEDVIGSLENNAIFWLMFWESTRRGGHYHFDMSRPREDAAGE